MVWTRVVTALRPVNTLGLLPLDFCDVNKNELGSSLRCLIQAFLR